jgi:hypothetical protein
MNNDSLQVATLIYCGAASLALVTVPSNSKSLIGQCEPVRTVAIVLMRGRR